MSSPRSASGAGGTRAATWVLLGLVLAWSLALRLFFGLHPIPKEESFDEQYNIRNVQRILATGHLKPQNGYYSFLSYAPQTAVAAAFERLSQPPGNARFAIFTKGRVTRFGLRGFRVSQAIYGTVIVLLVFLIARRLDGDAAGLIAALLASSSWTYIRIGAWFKPDALTALCASLAVLWTLRADEESTAKRYGLAGVGIGLATSAKLIGALTAIPLALTLLGTGAAARRRWLLLVLAGVTSVLTFFATSPNWRTNLIAARAVSRDYVWRGANSTYLQVLSDIYGGLWSALHGPFVAVLFWIGVAASLIPAASRHLEPARRRSLRIVISMSLVFPVGVLLLSRATFLRNNNVFAVLPLVTAVASATAVGLFRRSAPLLGRLAPAAVAIVATALLVVPPVLRGTRAVYTTVVPTTEDAARAKLRRVVRVAAADATRMVFLENPAPSGRSSSSLRQSRDGRLIVDRVESLAEVGAERLARADAEIFRESRLRGGESAFYAARVKAARGTPTRIPPEPLQLRGPSLLLLAHPWHAAAREILQPIEGGPAGRLSYLLPAGLDAGELISLTLRLPANLSGLPALRLGTRDLAVRRRPGPAVRRHLVHFTDRIPAQPGGVLELSTPPPRKTRKQASYPPIVVELWRWSKSAPAANPAAGSGRDAAGKAAARHGPGGKP